MKKVLPLLIISFLLLSGVPEAASQNFPEMREKMVTTQIKARGIKDQRLIEAMLKVERHRFVPRTFQASAYIDRPLPIGKDQTISQPYIVALMTELLNLKGEEKVLEIGTGSGYQAAILAELAGEIYSIEIIEELAQRAAQTLKDLGYQNITVKTGDGYLGWEEYAPFDAIIVTCAPAYIPQPLIDQLKDGGKMVIPVGEDNQKLQLLRKNNGRINITEITPVRFVPMIHEREKELE